MSGASSGTSSSSPFRGIYVSSGLTTVGDVTANTIGSLSSTGAISYTSSSASTSEIYGSYHFGSAAWTVKNNNVGGITANNSSTGACIIYGLRVNTSTSVTSLFQNNTIGGSVSNSIYSTSTANGSLVAGIFLTSSNGTVTGNTIQNLTASGGTGTTTSASVQGITGVSASTNHSISQNIIQNLTNTNVTAAATITGIQYTCSTGTNLISRNFIHNFSGANGPAIIMVSRLPGGTATYQNNMIALGTDPSGASITTNVSINGINELGDINGFFLIVYTLAVVIMH